MPVRIALLTTLLALAACGPAKPDQTTLDPATTTTGGEDTSGAPTATAAPDPTSGGSESPPDPSAPPDPATSEPPDPSVPDPSSTTAPPGTTDATTGDPVPCDVGLQDCPEGQKCSVFTDGQDSIFQGMFGCFPVDPDPQPPHAPCDFFGDPLDGTDNCELGSICLDIPRDGVGECFAFCDFTSGDPVCSVANDVCIGATCQTCTWSFCDANCDILDPAGCEPDTVCAASGDTWICIPDASGDDGQHGDPCEFVNDCDHGFACLDQQSFPACAGASCCAAACDVTAPDACPDQDQGVACTPWYEPGTAPSDDLADIGVCVLPP